MIDKPSKLYYKAIFEIYPLKEGRWREGGDLLASVLDVISGYIQEITSADINPLSFRSHGIFSAPDGKSKASVASAHMIEHEESPFLWAMKLICLDAVNQRRTWCTHVSVSLHNEESLTLCFATMYADNQGGYLSSIKPPVITVPTLVNNLMDSEIFACCSGRYFIPTEPIEMFRETIPVFLDVLNDTDRTIPVILVCCPDIIEPSGLNMRLKGNAIIYYILDMDLIFALNDALPPNMQVDFESIRIYSPIQENYTHNPQIPLQTINEQGAKNIVAQMSRAYSENLRTEERKRFITLDDILAMRGERQTTSLQSQLEKSKSSLKELRKKHDQVVSELNETKVKLLDGGIQEYEELLSLCLKEKDNMIAGINAIIERLYTGRGKGFTPQSPPTSVMHQLERAIQFCVGSGIHQ